MTAGDSDTSVRAQLAALRDVLRRHESLMAERIDSVLRGSDAEAEEFLISRELWGKTGSFVYRSGIEPSWVAQQELEEAFGTLADWQMLHGYVNQDVSDWAMFFRQRRGLSRRHGGERPVDAALLSRVAVPWSVRDVWLGVLAAFVISAAAWAVVYLVTVSSARISADLWVAVVPTLLELLLLVPVWWFVIHKRGGSLKALGFVGFRFWVVAMGIGLFFAYLMFNGLYARLLEGFGQEIQGDLSPIFEQLSTPWPLIVTIVVVAPVVEETFFRGFVFAGLRARYDWRWAAVISAALFAASHMELTFFIPAFLMGLLFAYLYQSSDSVWPGMIIHAVMNTLAVTVMYVL